VALAIVLLVSAGLLLRSLSNLFAISPGFDASNLLTMQVQTSGRRFDNPATQRFFAQALENVRRAPGVTRAAFTSQLPLSGDLDEYGVHFEASPARPAETHPGFRYAVSPGYIETMGIALRRGRFFDQHDSVGAPLVALISESLARRRFADADPLGQRLRIGPPEGPPYTVVGVVDNVKQLSLAARELDAVYIPASQWSWTDRVMWLVVRGRGDAGRVRDGRCPGRARKMHWYEKPRQCDTGHDKRLVGDSESGRGRGQARQESRRDYRLNQDGKKEAQSYPAAQPHRYGRTPQGLRPRVGIAPHTPQR